MGGIIMNKLYRIVLIIVAFCATVTGISAQDWSIKGQIGELTFPSGSYEVKNNVGFSKLISEPLSDGTYWIKLEAFATGSAVITSTNNPVDIVLVLDTSTSMDEAYGDKTRLQALRDGVDAFIHQIAINDGFVDEEGQTRRTDENGNETTLGNRIAMVKFQGTSTQICGFLDVFSNETTLRGYATSLSTNANDRGTRTDLGLNNASTLMSSSYARTDKNERSRVVVMFTDGCPCISGPDAHGGIVLNATVADAALKDAYTIKHNYDARIYTIGIISSDPSDWMDDRDSYYENYEKVMSFLDYLSSDYPTAASDAVFGTDGSEANAGTRTENKYFQDATNTDLKTIFEAIAKQSGGSENTSLSSATSTIDVVSSSFKLPNNADASSIKVFTAKCLTATSTGEYTFATEILANHSEDKYDKYTYDEAGHKILLPENEGLDVDNEIVVDPDKIAENVIEVTGFDYSNNWCGPIKNASGQITGAQGHKLIIMIPIQMDENAVGGPNVQTNGPGSGIYVSGDDEESLIEFTSPTVSLPVNIHIYKEGLRKGESAKFTILRQRDREATWTPVTSVFVTQKETGTPVTYVRGLPATDTDGTAFVYQVREDEWSWSYSHSDPQYTNSGQVTNPFTFTNTKKDGVDYKIRHAESKATNVFHTDKETKTYDDSKTNDRSSGSTTTPDTGNTGN